MSLGSLCNGGEYPLVLFLFLNDDMFPSNILLQPGERRRPRAAFSHHSEDFQLQQKPVAADLAHGYGVHEEKGAGE